MSFVESLKSFTVLRFDNLSSAVDEDYLRSKVLSKVQPNKCDVKIARNVDTGESKNYAFVNVGSHEKAQLTIREINGTVSQGKTISVSLHLDPARTKSYPARLYGIPDSNTNEDLFDIVTKFGDIARIDCPLNATGSRSEGFVDVWFLTADAAEEARQTYRPSEADNANRQAPQTPSSIMEDQRPGFAGLRQPDLPGSPDTAFHNVVGSGASAIPRPTTGLDKQSTPVHTELTRRDGQFRVYSTENDLVLFLDLESKTEEEKVKALCSYLDKMHVNRIRIPSRRKLILEKIQDAVDVPTLISIALDTKMFRIYSILALDAIESKSALQYKFPSFMEEDLALHLNLDQLYTTDSKKKCVSDYLSKIHGDRYGHERVKEILRLVVPAYDEYKLLHLANDESAFRILAMFAIDALLENKSTIERRALSNEAMELALDLQLDVCNSIDERKQLIRSQLYHHHEGNYSSENLNKKLDALVPAHGVYELLEVALNDEVFEKLALNSAVDVVLSPEQMDIALQLGIAKLDSETERKELLREQLYFQLLDCYEDRLTDILDVLMRSLNVSEMIQISADENLSRIYALFAQDSIENKKPFERRSLPEEVRNLVIKWSLDRLGSAEERKERICEELLKQHETTYDPLQLQDILGLVRPLNMYELLRICTDKSLFRLYVVFAQDSLESGEPFEYKNLTPAAKELVLQLDLDKLESIEMRRIAIKSQLCGMYESRYGPVIADILEKMLLSLNIYELLDVALDESEFRIYVIFAREAIQNNTLFEYRFLYFPAKELARELDLDLFQSTDDMKVALRNRLRNSHSLRYDHDRLNDILNMLQNSLGVYELLAIALNDDEFRVSAIHAQEANENRRDLEARELSKPAKELALELNLDRLHRTADRKLALCTHMRASYGHRYESECVDEILRTLQKSLDVYKLLDIAFQEDDFRIHAIFAQDALENKTSFQYFELTPAARGLALQLGLDTLRSIDERKQTVRKYLRQQHEDHYGRESLGNILRVLLSTFGVYELLRVGAEKKQFRIHAMYAQDVIVNGGHFPEVTLPPAAADLALELKLDRIGTTEERKQVVSEYLHKVHQVRYGRDILKKILNVLLHTYDVYELLRISAQADEFHLHAIYAQDAIESNSPLEYVSLSKDEKVLAHQFNLDMYSSVIARKDAICDQLYRFYLGRYDEARLQGILIAARESLDVYQLLRISASETEFRLLMITAQYAFETKEPYTPKNLPHLVKELALKLDLDTRSSIVEQKQVVRAELSLKYAQRYRRERLDKILHVLTDALNVYELLAILLDESEFFVQVLFAQESIDKCSVLRRRQLPFGAKEFALLIDLDLKEKTSEWKGHITSKLYSIYINKYPCDKLETILDILLRHYDVFEAMDIGYDENQFRIFSIFARERVETMKPFEVKMLTFAAKKLALELNLDKLNSVNARSEAVRDYTKKKYGGQYGAGKIDQILDALFGRYSIYDLLQIVADDKDFDFHALFVQDAIDSNAPIVFETLSLAAKKLAFKLGLSRIDGPAGRKAAIYNYYTQNYQHRYDPDTLKKILEVLIESLSIYDLIRIGAEESLFRIYAALVQDSLKKNKPFEFRFLSSAEEESLLRSETKISTPIDEATVVVDAGVTVSTNDTSSFENVSDTYLFGFYGEGYEE